MNTQITDADLQTMLRENPLASEQLRRIVAERQRDELLSQIAGQNGSSAEPVIEPSEVVSSGIG